MYSKMAEEMLQMAKIQYGATLECKWEAFKKVIFSCTNKWFPTKHITCKGSESFKKQMWLKEIMV